MSHYAAIVEGTGVASHDIEPLGVVPTLTSSVDETCNLRGTYLMIGLDRPPGPLPRNPYRELREAPKAMKTEIQVPDPQLMESMRSVGYSIEAAIADLVDNSIAAEASSIEVLYRSDGESVVGILDNGNGMNPDDARVALRLAGTSRGNVRDPRDLGRFGLGLKTASLSQGRSVTVVTQRDGIATALRWDLDFLASVGSWSLQVLAEDDWKGLPFADRLVAYGHGTLVLWQKLDLLLGDTEHPASHMAEKMAIVASHLELVFHRYIAGEGQSKPVRMYINQRQLKRVDPFLERNPGTQVSPVEYLGAGDSKVLVRAYTLPHMSALSAEDREYARTGDRMRDSQGFYVYRNRRLIDWGSWFRLSTKDELAKLARVRVDIPNTLDSEWGLDIKKSRAIPPESVKRELRRLIDRIVGQSRTVHTFRGRAAQGAEDGVLVWEKYDKRDAYAYRINRSHPLFVSTELDGPNFDGRVDAIFTLVEQMFPINDLYMRMSSDKPPVPSTFDEAFLVSAATEMWSRMAVALHGNYAAFTELIAHIEPFSAYPDFMGVLEAKQMEITNV